MRTLAELEQLNLDADTKSQVAGLVQMLIEQAQKEVHSRHQALTMELAYLRRIRFGKKKKSMSLAYPVLLSWVLTSRYLNHLPLYPL